MGYKDDDRSISKDLLRKTNTTYH